MVKRLVKALIGLRVCADCSEALLVAHTTLLEIAAHIVLHVNNKGTDQVVHVHSLGCTFAIRYLERLLTALAAV